jgi:hypothetical protein
VLTRITIDERAVELVRAQGFELTDVPSAGTTVKLTLTGNMSTGGISIDRTLEAHPDNVEIAEEAARVVGLDVAGIDFICPDIAEPVREVGGGICEVNAAPGFRMHTHPTIGEAQYVAKPVVDLLFPAGTPSRIPIVAVTGTNGKTTTCRMISHIFKGMGRKVGMTSTDGIVIDERLLIRADASGTEVGPDGPAEPAGRLRGVRGGARRHPARGPGLPAQRRRRRAQRRARTTWACAGSTRSNSWPRSSRSSSKPSPVTASPSSTPTTRSSSTCAAAAPARWCGSRWPSPVRRHGGASTSPAGGAGARSTSNAASWAR